MAERPGAHWRPRAVPVDPAAPPLILFDGVCNLCSFWVGFVIRRDTDALFRFVPAQTEAGQRLMAACGLSLDDPESNVVLSGGEARFKSDAALSVLGRLPGWRWAPVLAVLPRPVRDWLYDRVARNRYAVFGRKDACLIPTPDISSRFVTRAEDLPQIGA